MKNNRFAAFLFILSLLTCCFSDNIEITLPTTDKEYSIYICNCKDANYELANLINYVVLEDFKVDGRGKLFEKNEKSLALEKKGSTVLFEDPFWTKEKIDFVITPNLSNQKVTFDIFDVRKQSVKTLSQIDLSGSSIAKIKALHRLSDFLMEQIYGQGGIASKKILYSYKPYNENKDNDTNPWNAEIYETDTLGLINTRVTFDNSYSITPEFISSDGGKEEYDFIYVTYQIGQPQIYIGKNNADKGKPLIKLRGNQLLPKVSYDKKYISFVSDASGNSDIFIQSLGKDFKTTGKPIQIYSGLNQTSASPHLSPDNKYIAFVSDKTGEAKIYIAAIEKTISERKTPVLEKIISPCTECTCPCFSPDGTKLAFSGKINGRRQIWIYDITKKKTYQITSGAEDKENPCFGSDNKHIVYNTTSPATDLFLLTLETGLIRRLTKGSGEKHYPTFEK
jgi:TolB protein